MTTGIYKHRAGWHHSQETIDKIKSKKKGTSFGYKFEKGHKDFTTKEGIEKLKKILKGRIPKNHKWLVSDEGVKEKRRKGLIKYYENHDGYWKGKPMSGERKNKLSKYNLSIGRTPPYYWGEKHPNWKGGMTQVKVAIRKLKQYKDWTLETYKKDSYKCQKCHSIGKNLEAHHVGSFIKVIRDNKIKTTEEAIKCNELWKRGITLCRKCHLFFHKNYGKITNREMLDIFLEPILEPYDIERDKRL